MKIIKKYIKLCIKCNNYTGFVEEAYNGYMPVYCMCNLDEERKKGGWRSPCIISPNGDNLY